MTQWIYMNGKYVTKEQAQVSVYDHGYLYGDGIFEGIRVYNGNIFRCKEHLDRLYDSAKSIMLNIPLSYQQMQDALVETIQRNELKDGYIRLIVSRGPGDLGLDPTRSPKASVVIIVEQLSIYPEEAYVNGLNTISVSTRRNIPDAINPKIKSLNYLNNILVKIQSNLSGVGEAIMVNSQGFVAEGSSDNIFIIKRGIVYTPLAIVALLKGLQEARLWIFVNGKESNYGKNRLPCMMFMWQMKFFTGTAAEVIAVRQVDGRVIGEGKAGPITTKLLKSFREIVEIEGVKVYE
ncbi:branched-chain-amino-acid transaminase [Paenibacillus larvae]|uniref:branched-chain-amino-acid transaminase n=1 Tax=Paenibacillus larvae TaxID=1464 RepID=UPI00288E657A|nr:branched-chain-amino-acid transaminase [Paenibacillus larvae]MDT2193688.1 branched-chain-amino-acid transaminase [Paenibacillus larvae]